MNSNHTFLRYIVIDNMNKERGTVPGRSSWAIDTNALEKVIEYNKGSWISMIVKMSYSF